MTSFCPLTDSLTYWYTDANDFIICPMVIMHLTDKIEKKNYWLLHLLWLTKNKTEARYPAYQ